MTLCYSAALVPGVFLQIELPTGAWLSFEFDILHLCIDIWTDLEGSGSSAGLSNRARRCCYQNVLLDLC